MASVKINSEGLGGTGPEGIHLNTESVGLTYYLLILLPD
jgi:hypothetical protein